MKPVPPRSLENTASILTMIQQIPVGKVATYGQIAKLAGIPRNSRQVGSVLRSLPHDSGIPWHRVVNARGQISQRGSGDSEIIQRNQLLAEGISFDEQGRISLVQFGWKLETTSPADSV